MHRLALALQVCYACFITLLDHYAISQTLLLLLISTHKKSVNIVNIAPGDYKTEILNNRRDSDNPSSSPYFHEYEKIIKSVKGKMNHGRDPIEVASLVLKIIKKKNPKINYIVGGFLEKKITLKSLLPDKLFQKIIMKLYS